MIGGFDFPVDPELDARDADVIWSPSDAPAVTTLFAPIPGSGGSDSLNSPPGDAGSHAGCSFAFRNLDPRVTVGLPRSGKECPLAALLPFDEYWPARVEAAGRARQALLGKSTPRLIPMHRCRRIQSALRVNDGRDEDASYKRLAIAVFGRKRVDEEHWKTSALKAQIARLSHYGRALISFGYRSILLGRAKTSMRRDQRSL